MGQLGIGTTGNGSDSPVQVPGLSGITQVVAGSSTSYALRSDGTVLAWGQNHFGEMGNGTDGPTGGPQVSPAPVLGVTGITQLAPINGGAFALRSDGTVLAWGDNEIGELGTGTSGGISNVPVAVPGLTGVTRISSAYDGLYILVIRGSNHAVWGWGDNSLGELGDGTTTDRTSPEATGLTGADDLGRQPFRRPGHRRDLGPEHLPGAGHRPDRGNSGDHVRRMVRRGRSARGVRHRSGRGRRAPRPGDQHPERGCFALGSVRNVIDGTCTMIGQVLFQNPPAGTVANPGSSVSNTVGAQDRADPCL